MIVYQFPSSDTVIFLNKNQIFTVKYRYIIDLLLYIKENDNLEDVLRAVRQLEVIELIMSLPIEFYSFANKIILLEIFIMNAMKLHINRKIT